jgi:non-ribosomal peptide synthetase component F
VLDAALTGRLVALGRQHGATIFMTLLAATFALAHRLTGADDIVLGSVTHNRDDAALETIVGCFVNLVPLRVQVRPEDRFSTILAAVRSATLDALQHAYPFDRLVNELRLSAAPGRSPLFDVGFSWNGMEHVARRRLADLEMSDFGEPAPVAAKYDLLIVAGERDGAVEGVIEYDAGLFDEATVALFASQLVSILEQACGGGDPSVTDLDLGGPAAAVQPLAIALDF